MSEIEILYAELLNNQNPIHCTRKELCDAVDSAAEALQEKQERENGCEYCNKEKPILQDCDNGFSIEIQGEELSVWNEDECVAIFTISNCPMCGRKLGENDG